MSYSPNAVSFIKPWKVRHICPFPQRLLSGHSVQWGVLRHILRSTMTDKRLTGLALMNIHTDLEIDSEEVLKQFDATGRRAMRFGCNPLFARACVCAFLLFFTPIPLQCFNLRICACERRPNTLRVETECGRR